jgi:apolipoprotein N-acyltransferase
MTSNDFGTLRARELWVALGRAHAFVRALQGWRARAVAFGVGLLSALSFAPFGIFPFLLFAFAALVLLIDGAQRGVHPKRDAMFVGWAFGFGHFLAGLYWIGYAFTVDAAAHAWQLPFVAVLFPGGLALFPALACLLASAFWRPGAARIFVFAGAYGIAEWLRGHVLTGFPWNLAAYSWGALPGILQSAAVIGAYGLTIATVLLGASLAELGSPRPRSWLLPTALSALFVFAWLGGELRLALVDPGTVPGVALRLVQPGVPQQEKYLPQFRARNWQRLVALSIVPAEHPPTHIIWPEAAPPFLLAQHPEAMADVAFLTTRGRVLLTGAVRVEASVDGGFRAFNGFYVFGRSGQLLDVYDKFHLVPFGEYLPLAQFLGALGITKLVEMPDGFTPGPGPQAFIVPGAPPAGPLICYEILFPGAVVGRSRPGWFVNVTDDSWFGDSSGPYQHLLTARVRAIEEGIPVARAANTGISAVIDPLGRVISSLDLGKVGVVDASLPRALPVTPYARLGDVGFGLILALCGLFGLWRNRQPKNERPDRDD